MVSSNTEQGSGWRSEQSMNVHLIKELVERRSEGEEKRTGEKNEKRKEVRGGSTRESRTSEVNSTIQVQDVR